MTGYNYINRRPEQKGQAASRTSHRPAWSAAPTPRPDDPFREVDELAAARRRWGDGRVESRGR
jgi:hypothetical protein